MSLSHFFNYNITHQHTHNVSSRTIPSPFFINKPTDQPRPPNVVVLLPREIKFPSLHPQRLFKSAPNHYILSINEARHLRQGVFDPHSTIIDFWSVVIHKRFGVHTGKHSPWAQTPSANVPGRTSLIHINKKTRNLASPERKKHIYLVRLQL